VTRTEAEYAAVLADLLIEARGDGVDVATIIAVAIGEGLTATAELEAVRDRCSQRLWPVSRWSIGVDWAAGEGSPPPTIAHGRYTPCGCQRAVVERDGHVESVIVHRAGCWAVSPAKPSSGSRRT
jgi:hypothetical protein